jgi:hypothetical protein
VIYAHATKCQRNQLLSRVDARTGQAAAINQIVLSSGKGDKGSVALVDTECNDLKFSEMGL